MSYHYHKKKKKRLQRGEKLVLKFGIPITIVVAIIIQLTVKGIPVFLNNILKFIDEQSKRSRVIIAGYAAEKSKDAKFRTEKKFQPSEDFELGASKFSSNPYSPSKETLVKELQKYKKDQRDADDPIYQEIKRRELKEEIEDYQKIFEEEKDSR